MMIIAVFFLIWPGEYCASSAEAHPFRIQDLQLYQGATALQYLHTPAEELLAASSVHLTFTTQKNAVRGEVIAQGRSGDGFFCPVKAAARRLIHLRSIQAPTNTPVHHHRTNEGRLKGVASKDITTLLRQSIQVVGPRYGVRAGDTNARALRASGAMALMNAQVDTDAIRLIGRWQSDSMLRYLHAQALPNIHSHARSMMRGGLYTFGPPLPPPQGQPIPGSP